jgi:hypothetical protein
MGKIKQSTIYVLLLGSWSVDLISGDVTYIPAVDYYGIATINYTIEDNDGNVSNIALIEVAVNSVVDPWDDFDGDGNRRHQ